MYVIVAHLSIIVEVTKLCLPADELVRRGLGETKLKPQHCKFTERAVTHCIVSLFTRC